MTASPGEFELIARYFAPLAPPEALGLADDAMSITPPEGCDLVVTKDMLVEGVHFFADDAPRSIARKALGVNLSDLAAKAAEPLGFFLGFGRSGRQDAAWLDGFAAGLEAMASASGCKLFGGDTVTAPVLTLSITAVGSVTTGRMIRRQGGEPGDAVFVTGTIGDAALGLQARMNPQAPWLAALTSGQRAHLLDRYLHPQPRLALRMALLACASGAMDVSDGLVGDCDKLSARHGRVMEVAAVPLSLAAQAAIAADETLLDIVLTGGDDYEVIATVPPEKITEFTTRAGDAGITVSRIGTLTREGAGANWRMKNGDARHFVSRSFVHGAGT